MPPRLPLHPPKPLLLHSLRGRPGQSLRHSGARQDAFADSAPRVAAVAMETARSNKSIPPGVREARRGNGSGGTAGAPRRRRVQRGASRAAAPPPSPAGPSPEPPLPQPALECRQVPPRRARPRGPHPLPPALGLGCAPRCSNGAHGTLAGGGADGRRRERGVPEARTFPMPPPLFSLNAR